MVLFTLYCHTLYQNGWGQNKMQCKGRNSSAFKWIYDVNMPQEKRVKAEKLCWEVLNDTNCKVTFTSQLLFSLPSLLGSGIMLFSSKDVLRFQDHNKSKEIFFFNELQIYPYVFRKRNQIQKSVWAIWKQVFQMTVGNPPVNDEWCLH